jgi:hypothetical protein
MGREYLDRRARQTDEKASVGREMRSMEERAKR